MDRPGVVDREPDPRYEATDAPEARSLPVPDHSVDGERGYEPVRPRSGLVDLLAQAGRADHRARLPRREVRRAAPEAEGRDDGSLDAGLDRGVRVAVGTPVRDRLRAADLRPRARPRARASPSGSACERSAVHPVPRCRDRDEGAARRRLEGSARRARGADPRIGRRRGLLGRGRDHRVGGAHGPRVRRVPAQPLQPHPDRPARRRTCSRRVASRRSGSSACC